MKCIQIRFVKEKSMNYDKNIWDLDPRVDFGDLSNMNVIACLGDNTAISPEDRDISIIAGYKISGKLIYEAVLNGQEFSDPCIYPLFFNCRHSVELQLKMLIRSVFRIHQFRAVSKKKSEPIDKKVLNSHSISNLVDYLYALLELDKELESEFLEFEIFSKLINDFKIDNGSDAFRYTFTKSGGTNLEKEVRYNLEVFYNKYLLLMDGLEYFYHICDVFIRERLTGTFTSKLSRVQLQEISKLIDFNNWEAIKENKEKICKNYNLSSNDFSKAINIIKKHREFSKNAGKEIQFGNISNQTLINLAAYMNIASQVYLINSKLPTITPISKVEDPVESKSKAELIKKTEEMKISGHYFLENATSDEICDIMALFSIGTVSDYSEGLDAQQQFWKQQNLGKHYYSYILSKVQSSERFISALRMCGQNKYLSIIAGVLVERSE